MISQFYPTIYIEIIKVYFYQKYSLYFSE